MKNQKILQSGLVSGLAAILLLSGCRLPAPAPQDGTASVVPDALYTSAAETIAAQLTEAVVILTNTPPATPTLPEPPTPTQTPAPSETPLASATPVLQLTASSTPTLRPEITLQPGAIFEDDFETDRGWTNLREDNFVMEYTNGAYRIFVDLVTTTSPVFSIRSQELEDVRVEVDAIRAAGPEDSFFGLLCRFRDQDNYYRLVIGTDGFYGIGKKVDGEFSNLVSNTQQGVINAGAATNRVRADCIGNELTLYANGVQLLSVQDNDLRSGDVGLVAGTRTTRGADILFDNFAVYRP